MSFTHDSSVALLSSSYPPAVRRSLIVPPDVPLVYRGITPQGKRYSLMMCGFDDLILEAAFGYRFPADPMRPIIDRCFTIRALAIGDDGLTAVMIELREKA